MEPVSNLGKFGRLLLVIVGIILIVMGTAAIVDQRPPKDSAETTATITDFRTISDGGDRSSGRMVTIVAYTAEGKEYRNIELGQYEAQWKKGDHISIYYSASNPTDIRSRTMTYGGWLLVLASLPFLIIGIYMLANVRKRNAKTPEEIAEDEERTTEGKLKYKASSVVIPLGSGIPVLGMGIIFLYLEHSSALGLLLLILGGIASLVGIRSAVLFLMIMRRHRKELKEGIPAEAVSNTRRKKKTRNKSRSKIRARKKKNAPAKSKKKKNK